MSEGEFNCNVEGLQRILSEHGKVLLMVVTTECPHGAAMRQLVRDNLDKFDEKGITVVELETDTKRCLDLARELDVQHCPTMLMYDRRKEVNRFIPAGESPSEALDKLLKFKSEKKGGSPIRAMREP